MSKKLREDDLNAHLQGDMTKWEETLASNDTEKKNALKKTLLLIGSFDLQVYGHGKQYGISAAENKLPVSTYLSGHMGRVYSTASKGQGKEILYWIDGDANKVMKPRLAGTHAGEIDASGNVVEERLSQPWPSYNGYRMHRGIDVAMGKKDGKYNSAVHDSGTIKDDGTGGHIYYNLNSKKRGDTIGIGLELTPPSSKPNYLGEHSKSGDADQFTALEGAKFAVKLEDAVKSKKWSIEDITTVENLTAKQKLEKHFSWLEKRLSEQDLGQACEDLGIKFVDEKKEQALTRLGRECAEAGIVPQNNYNGAKMNIDDKRWEEIQKITAKDIPDEIIYFKPKPTLDEFLAQKEIFKNMDQRPVLKDNPQFSYEACEVIGRLYDKIDDGRTDNYEKGKIQEFLNKITKDDLETLGLNINKFEFDQDSVEKIAKSFDAKDLQVIRMAVTTYTTPQPHQSVIANKVTADSPLQEVTADSPLQEVTADSPLQEVTADPPLQEVTADPPLQEVTADPPLQEVTADSPLQEVIAELLSSLTDVNEKGKIPFHNLSVGNGHSLQIRKATVSEGKRGVYAVVKSDGEDEDYELKVDKSGETIFRRDGFLTKKEDLSFSKRNFLGWKFAARDWGGWKSTAKDHFSYDGVAKEVDAACRRQIKSKRALEEMRGRFSTKESDLNSEDDSESLKEQRVARNVPSKEDILKNLIADKHSFDNDRMLSFKMSEFRIKLKDDSEEVGLEYVVGDVRRAITATPDGELKIRQFNTAGLKGGNWQDYTREVNYAEIATLLGIKEEHKKSLSPQTSVRGRGGEIQALNLSQASVIRSAIIVAAGQSQITLKEAAAMWQSMTDDGVNEANYKKLCGKNVNHEKFHNFLQNLRNNLDHSGVDEDQFLRNSISNFSSSALRDKKNEKTIPTIDYDRAKKVLEESLGQKTHRSWR